MNIADDPLRPRELASFKFQPSLSRHGTRYSLLLVLRLTCHTAAVASNRC